MISLTTITLLWIGAVDSFALDVIQHLMSQGATVLVGSADNQQDSAIVTLDLLNPSILGEQLANLPEFHAVILSPNLDYVGRFMQLGDTTWDAALSQNFESLVYAAQQSAHLMIQRQIHGRIIFLSSVMSLMPFSGASALGTPLSGLHTIAKMAAVDLGQHGITVNTLALGWFPHEAMQPYIGQAHITQGIPLGRLGNAEDVANTCAFLLSPMASYLTGALIPLDGGYTLTKSEGEVAFGRRE